MPRDADRYDLFVSYARADDRQGWVSTFLEQLCEEHRRFTGGRTLEVFFDREQIRSFDDWHQRIYTALATSRLFLAFLSPHYFASQWCRREWKAWIDLEIAKHILSDGAAPIYFVEVPGLVGNLPGLQEPAQLDEHTVARKVAELCGLPPQEEQLAATAQVVHQIRSRRQIVADFVQPLSRQGIAALRREDLRRVLARLAEEIEQRSAQVRRAGESPSTVPPYNKRFTGRLDELLELRERLLDDRAGVICGVHGLGGIGKTELAFTYAHAFAGVYPGGRFLVPCEGKSSLRDAALVLGDLFRDRISDQQRKTPDAHFAAIIACLAERLEEAGHILLVLDNVTDPKLLAPEQTDLLTRLGPKLHLLATTRLLPPSGRRWLTLGELPEADALELLEKHRPFADQAEREAGRQIVRRLGGFALAVELVAAGLAAHPSASYVQVAAGLGLDDLDLLAEDQNVELRRHNHQRRLQAVLGPTLAGLEPPQRRTMEYAALLAPNNVPLPWLRELVVADFPQVGQQDRWGDRWEELCRRLVRLALFVRTDEESTSQRLVRVHRLVQDLIRAELAGEELAARQKAVDELIGRRVAALEQTTQWQDARWELEPLEALAELWAETEHSRAAWLLNAVGSCWHSLAEWSRAETLYRRELVILEKSVGPDHPNVATALNNLGGLLQATGRLAEAEAMFRRTLAIRERSLRPDHPKVATALNNLAGLLQERNRLAEAEPLLRRALAIDEAAYGPDHPEVAPDLNNLAGLLSATNARSSGGRSGSKQLGGLALGHEPFGGGRAATAPGPHHFAEVLWARSPGGCHGS